MSGAEGFRTHRVPADLAGMIEQVWTVTGSTDGAIEPIVPDGCVELVLNFGEPFEQLVEGSRVTQPFVMVAGEIRRPVMLVSPRRVDAMGIRFVAGRAAAVLDTPASELVDGMFGDDAVGTGSLRVGLEAVRAASPADRIRRLFELLRTDRRRSVLARPGYAAVDRIRATRGLASMASVSEAAGISLRQLQRQVLESVGISPKQFAQVRRFCAVARAAEVRGHNLASLASEYGYADQSHLVRAFHRFSGHPPSHYLRLERPLGGPLLAG